MQDSAPILVIPLAAGIVALTVLAPHQGDRVIAQGMLWGIVGCAIYDGFRLTTVHVFGWWADFIPTMGTWITGDPDDMTSGAVVGYLWRYIGDGGGIGITFFAIASALGLQKCSRRTTVLAAVAFSVFPVWAGLIATVWHRPAGPDHDVPGHRDHPDALAHRPPDLRLDHGPRLPPLPRRCASRGPGSR